ncbi:leupaxin isoform X2 [Melanerpes formicivorus]|uniref:leupaxin isoform X2 n=1 Tax=Melanerpes formicivorus TaxID=211600 RepID=UPI00358EAF89
MRPPQRGRPPEDALLAELEQSSCLASKDCSLQVLSSFKQDPVPDEPPTLCGREALASAAPEAQTPPQAQPLQQTLKTTPSPTAAAQQLDELLAALGQMQSKGCLLAEAAGEGAKVPAEPSPSLDSMLGNLTQDLQQLGITTAPAGICATCHKPIAGKVSPHPPSILALLSSWHPWSCSPSSSQVLTALGKTWHPEHFTCARCGEELGSQPFFEREGRAYCQEDYQQAFAPRCAYCAGPIREKVLTALGQTWHPEHFFCAHCGKVFGDEGFHEQNKKPYCQQDFLALFAPRCQGCERPVTDNYLSALQGAWHPECFVCADCLRGFAGSSFFELEGRPYCELHFYQRQGSLCQGCARPVTGRCITAGGRKYHPEHFTCAYCLGQLQKGNFHEHQDKMYCQACHKKLFL